jgi:hypothetical protein
MRIFTYQKLKKSLTSLSGVDNAIFLTSTVLAVDVILGGRDTVADEERWGRSNRVRKIRSSYV